MTSLNVVILAAGQGKRMFSALPKVLHKLGGKFLLEHVITTAQQLNPAEIHVIYGYQGDEVRTALSHLPVSWIQQKEQLGTGHALSQVLPQLTPSARTLVLNGDVPLIEATTLRTLLEKTPADELGMITVTLENPKGLGRILRNSHGHVAEIVEERDAAPLQRQIREVYSGILLVPNQRLHEWLPTLKKSPTSGEYYLTELIAIAAKERCAIHDYAAPTVQEVAGVNDRAELARLERYLQQQRALQLMQKGVTLIDPARFDLRGELIAGTDVVIDINVIIEGNVQIGNHCTIGPHSVLRNVKIGDHVHIKAYSIIEEAEIATGCQIGPFARIRPGTQLGENARIGNFVEVKNVKMGEGSKANHLSYLGDATIGKQVNIGAGTITCNYDGVNKHHTVIGDRAFIGSGTELIAPVTVGADATIGAGSTITKDAPPDTLTLSRSQQQTIAAWQRKKKRG